MTHENAALKRAARKGAGPRSILVVQEKAPDCLRGITNCTGWRASLEDQNGGGDGRRPGASFVANGALRNISCSNDLIREAIDFLLLVPALVRIKLYIQRGGEHLGGQFLGVFAGDAVGFAEAVVLAQIAVGLAVGGQRQAEAGGDQARRLAG